MRVNSQPAVHDEPAEVTAARRSSRFSSLATALRQPELQLPGWIYDTTSNTRTSFPSDSSPADAPTSVGLNPNEYLQNLGFEGALMLVMLDRLQGIQKDLDSQVSDIMHDNAVKRLYNNKMNNLNTMLSKAQDEMASGKKNETDTLTFTIDKSEVAVGSYQVKDEGGSPTLVESGSNDAKCITYTDNPDGTVTVKASVADIKAAIDKVRCSIDSLTTTSEIKSVRLQFLVQTKNSLVSLLTQTLNTEYETSMAPVKNIRVG